jgi:cytochrome c oxidase cbb3-type subunit 3
MSSAWSWYVIALVALNIGGCVWLLGWTGKRRPGDPKPTDTSHVWDGDITEYNKPMPRWWINLFYSTIVFSIGYLIYYPGLGAFHGTSGWTSAKEHDAKKAVEDQKLETTFSRYKDKTIDVLAQDPAALALGRSIFSHTCATCHGSSAQGAIGYPNLSDTIWHWGGSPERVLETVLEGREGVMPAWGQALGGDLGVTEVAVYLQSLRGETTDSLLASAGQDKFESLCAGCHGVDAKGNAQSGAPNLTDRYWLYGDSAETIKTSIADGRHGTMPSHRALLGETRARLVASYVWSLSNAPQPAVKR